MPILLECCSIGDRLPLARWLAADCCGSPSLHSPAVVCCCLCRCRYCRLLAVGHKQSAGFRLKMTLVLPSHDRGVPQQEW